MNTQTLTPIAIGADLTQRLKIKRFKVSCSASVQVNIWPEIVTGFILCFSLQGFAFTTAGLLLLVAPILLRFCWNGATLIHGLGHALAIATLDRQRSALTLTNILEHRSISATLRSLLPFHPIFLPFSDRQSSLWVAAGDTAPWRIRIKAISAIGFNFLAIVILWQFFPSSLNHPLTEDSSLIPLIGLFLSQTFCCANLLVILTSWSDMTAFMTGAADVLFCGNFGFVGRRDPEDDPSQLLPERVVNAFNVMGRETEIRGEQAGGGLVIASNLENQAVFIGKKVVNKKRDNLTESLEAAFDEERYRAALAGIKPLESTVTGVWHYRFGTSGPPRVSETHWHEWISEREVDVWQCLAAEWVCQLKTVNHRITHNGDFDAWRLFDQSINFTQLGWWLERVLHTPNFTQGDSAKIAGMMDLLITQGMWDASVRLAYQLEIAPSIESAFGGQQPAPDAPNTAPSERQIKRWAAIFERIFESDHQRLTPSHPSAYSQSLHDLESKILEAAGNDSSISEWGWQPRAAFVKAAIHAFLNNDLYFATKLFMSRAEGSFGLVTVSTLEPERLVLTAHGQSMAIGFNLQEEYMVYASEPAAVDAVLLHQPESHRLDLDQHRGEIALVGAQELTIYSMGQKSDVAPSELRNRWISMTEHPYLPHIQYPQSTAPDPIATDCQEIPKVLEKIKLSWQHQDSLNRKSADYLVQLLCERARHFEQRRRTMLRAGLTEYLQQSSSIDLLIVGMENSLWLGERFAQDLKIVFPLLNVRAISSNLVLQQLQYDFSSLQLCEDSIILAITQSGQTFPTVKLVNTFDHLYRQDMISEVFLLTGQLSSFLGSPAIQPKHSHTLRHNVFVNESGARTAEPATIAVAAAHQTLTELLLYLAQHLKYYFPDAHPFGMTLTEESCEALEKTKNDFLEVNVAQIIGTTSDGQAIETTVRRSLIAGGHKWAFHVLETPIAWGIHALYIAVTVGWSIPFGYNIPLATTILRLIIWATNNPQNVVLLEIAKPVATLIDIVIYIFGAWLWTLGLRYFQGRQLLARTGKRTLVIGDVPWVSKLLKSYVSKLFSLSYGIASLDVHGADPQDDLLHEFGHRIVRGTLLFLGAPDGRRGQRQAQLESAVIMTGKQVDGVRNIDVGPEVVMIGANPGIANEVFDYAIVLEGQDEPCAFNNQNPENQTKLIEDLRESRFGAFERLLASYVFFWALAKKVASFPILKYQYWKSQSRTKVMTTAAPVTGISRMAVPRKSLSARLTRSR